MDILFATDKLRKSLADERACQKAHGALAKPLIKRLDDLTRTSSLKEASLLPGRLEALTGNRAGQFSIRLSANYRLIFEAAAPVPRTEDGGIDIARVTAVRILSIEDYH